MLSMTMKLGQGDMVSVCGFVGSARDCHVTHVTWYGLNPNPNFRNRTLLFLLVKKRHLQPTNTPRWGKLLSLVSILNSGASQGENRNNPFRHSVNVRNRISEKL